MANATQSHMLRVKYIVFAGIAAMMAYVIYHNERFLIDPTNLIWQHYGSLGWWLLAHGLAGGCALILVPWQFSDRLRSRYAKVHRVVGRVSVAGALVLPPWRLHTISRRAAGNLPAVLHHRDGHPGLALDDDEGDRPLFRHGADDPTAPSMDDEDLWRCADLFRDPLHPRHHRLGSTSCRSRRRPNRGLVLHGRCDSRRRYRNQIYELQSMRPRVVRAPQASAAD